MKKALFSTQDISYISLCSVLLIICSWICVPMPIPFTLQNLGIVFSTLVLGKRRAFIAVLVYLFVGIAGFPVFSGFRSGLGVFTGPTGGYVLGMIFLPIIIGSFSEMNPDSLFYSLLGCATGMLILYIFGTAWYLVFFANGSGGILPVLSVCVFPFILPDIIKCVIGVICARKLRFRIICR